MSRNITALFPGRAEASAAVDRLIGAGFGRADISVLMAQEMRDGTLAPGLGSRDPAEGAPRPGPMPGGEPYPGAREPYVSREPLSDSHATRDPYDDRGPDTARETSAARERVVAAEARDWAIGGGGPTEPLGARQSAAGLVGKDFAMVERSKAPEGASAGAALGGALGGIVMGLAATGVLLIPGVNVVAAGPVLAVLAGVGAGGTAGGLLGGLAGLGIPEHEAKLVDEGLRRGGVLVGVYAHPERVQVARKILAEAGGRHVH